ncbi:hypothetical protein L5515_013511 [Caenorhabditis briggsae]|uniref:Uncharacterized protein n=1 Tax=Caenorhabditis briggsae TaxID=6238 RepID=A0AAE9EAH0_CAEBR|nr:hypothetical protein L5515_013511 [Caenorhabditis briggsae]
MDRKPFGSSRPPFSTPESRMKREYGEMKKEEKEDYNPTEAKRRYGESSSGGSGGSFSPIDSEKVQLNSWELDISKMDPYINKIMFKVVMVMTNEKRIDLADGLVAVSGDVNRQSRRQALCLLFNKWLEKNPRYFQSNFYPFMAAYDAAETFYVPESFMVEDIEENTSVLTENDFDSESYKTVSKLSRRRGTVYEVTVKSTGKLATRGPRALEEDNHSELTRCIECVSNQILHTNNFLLYSTGIYPVNGNVLSEPTGTTEIKGGFSKVSRVTIDGSEVKAHMTVDIARSCFFKASSMLKFIGAKYMELKYGVSGGSGGRGGRGGGRGGFGRGGFGRGGGGRGGGYHSGGGDRRDSSYRHSDDRGSGRDRYDNRDRHSDRDRHRDDRHRYDEDRDRRRDYRDDRDNGRSSEDRENNRRSDYDPEELRKFEEDYKSGRLCLSALNAVIKGLEVRPIHLDNSKANRTVILDSLCKESAETTQFEFRRGEDARDISVQEYFMINYNLKLKFPKMPVVVSKKRQQYEFYPLELLEIIPGQRLKNNKMTGDIQQFMTGANSSLPLDHIAQTRIILEDYLKLGGHQKNKHFDAFKIRFGDTRPIVVRSNILAPPHILFKPEKPHVIANGADVRIIAGRNETFVKPAKLRSIMIINYCGELREIDDFKRCLQGKFREHGFRYKDQDVQWIDERCDPSDLAKTKDLMKHALRNKVTLVIGIALEKMPHIHDVLNYYEEKIGQQTLQLCAETVRKMGQGGGNKTTVDNVIRKLNAKCGGTNFYVEVPNAVKNRLVCINPEEMRKKLYKYTQFIGFELSHTGARSKFDKQKQTVEIDPTIVGVSYTLKHATQLGGFSYFQDSRVHKLTRVKEKFGECLRGYKHATEALPRTIVMYRIGSGEGDYDQVRKEVEEMREAADSFEPGYKPRFLMVLAQRNSHVRIFPEHINKGNARVQNVRSGTCVDSIGSAHGMMEFILCCQSAMIGTVRPTRYTLMNVTYPLAFGHQVSYGPPSVPNVLYAAKNLAKRGQNNFKIHKDMINIRDKTKQLYAEYADVLGKKEKEEAVLDKFINDLSNQVNDCTISGRNFWA